MERAKARFAVIGMPVASRRAKLGFILASSLLLVGTLALWPRSARIPSTRAAGNQIGGTPATNNLLFVSGKNVAVDFGDFVSRAAGGLNSGYDYYIEVPPLRTSITIELFDADVGAGSPADTSITGAEFTAGLDDGQSSAVWDTTVTYTLTDPSGATVALARGDSVGTGFHILIPAISNPVAQNVFATLLTQPLPAPGHYRLHVEADAGNNTNAFGIRATDNSPNPLELNIYAESFINPGTTSNVTRNFDFYPYVTAGCLLNMNDWDSDDVAPFNNTQYTLTSRSGAFSQTQSTLSGNGVWNHAVISGWNNNFAALEYGIWHMALPYQATLGAANRPSNYGDFYADFDGGTLPPPVSQPVPGSLRIYLPTNAGGAPKKPYLTQSAFYVSGPNPPTAGMTTRFTICVEVNNPGQLLIDVGPVDATVPGGEVVFAGRNGPVPGTGATFPALGSGGDISWNPSFVPSGTLSRLCYFVDFTPTTCPTNVLITGITATGTRANYNDGTGTTIGNRQNSTFGPLCPLRVDCITTVPTPVEFESFDARSNGGQTLLEWRTGFESGNLGFNIYHEENGERVKLNRSAIAGSALLTGHSRNMTSGQAYSWVVDRSGGGSYWLEEISLHGERVMHGPFESTEDSRLDLSRYRNSRLLSTPLEASRGQIEQFDVGGSTGSTTETWAPSALGSGGRPSLTTMASAASATSKQRSLAGGAAVKISVSQTGWYHIGLSELNAGGLPAGVDLRLLQLFADGVEQPIKVTGSGDSSAVEFYGTGLDTTATDTRVYWLTVGRSSGKRIVDGPTLTGPQRESSFASVVERRDRNLYFAALNNGDADNFFGPAVTSTPADQVLTLRNLAPGDGVLDISMVGFSSLPGDSDHRVAVTVNGQSQGEIVFDGTNTKQQSFRLPAALLKEGDNTVTLTAMNGADDDSLVQYVRITYPRSFVAYQNGLQFTASGGQQVRLTGFTNDRVHVVDVTDASAVQELAVSVSSSGGQYDATVTVARHGERKLIASTEDAFARPRQLVPNEASQLATSNNQADLVIITHGDFETSLAPLKSLRESQGYKVAIVDVADVYDEFSFGAKSPQAIRDFLGQAKKSWKVAPRFVLLVGDASLDPRNYLQQGDVDFVPAKFSNTNFIEVSNDDWYTDFDSNDLADLPIGRLPVHTAAEAQVIVGKIAQYELGQPASERRVLLVSDSNDVADFEAATKDIGGLLPKTVKLDEVFRSQYDDQTAGSLILSALGEGPAVVNYIGHGGIDNWRGDLFTSRSSRTLNGQAGLGFYFMMDCTNGMFTYPTYDSLAEAALKSQGGAVVVWASSGFSINPSQVTIDRSIVQTVVNGWSQGGSLTIGEAALKAKALTSDLDVRRSWTLFGDPTTRIR